MKARVLVIDDHLIHRRMLLAAAQARGFELLEPCLTVNDAIASCGANAPQVIVFDLHLHGDFDGLTVCGLLREIVPHARLVVCSSFAESDLIERAFAAGAHRCLRKPFRLEEALRLFEHLAVELDRTITV